MSWSAAINETGAIEEQLARVNALLRGSIAKKSLRKSGGVVRRASRRRAPRSKRTGTRKLWSEKTAAARAGAKETAETITVVVRDYGERFVAVVGPEWPAGALGSLVAEGHKLVAWSKPTEIIVSGNDYLTGAADETKSEQEAVVINTITAEVDKALRPV